MGVDKIRDQSTTLSSEVSLHSDVSFCKKSSASSASTASPSSCDENNKRNFAIENSKRILDYWWKKDENGNYDYYAADMPKWFCGLSAENTKIYDTIVKEQFTELLKQAEAGEFFGWAMTKDSWMAHIILLDQMSRQIYRGSGDSFKNDKGCLIFVQLGWEMYKHELKGYEYMTALMPFVHSETMFYQKKCVQYFYDDFALISKDSPEYPVFDFMDTHVREHLRVIQKFGRFPKRNSVMGRENTQDEVLYLKRTDIKDRQY